MPTLRAFTAFFITVVLTVILTVADEAFINAKTIFTVESGSRAKQGICCCEKRKWDLSLETLLSGSDIAFKQSTTTGHNATVGQSTEHVGVTWQSNTPCLSEQREMKFLIHTRFIRINRGLVHPQRDKPSVHFHESPCNKHCAQLLFTLKTNGKQHCLLLPLMTNSV